MVKIRKAGPEDAEELNRVRAAGWRAAYAGLLPEEMIARTGTPEMVERQREVLRQGARALLAEDDGEAVGMAVYGPDRERPELGELYAIYVVPERLSTGVGRRLLERVVDDLRAAGHPRMSLWVLDTNDRARRFYERAGFTPTEQRDNERSGMITHDVRYERAL